MMTRLFQKPMSGFSTDMDRILQDMFGPLVHQAPAKKKGGIPLNTYEVCGGYHLEASLPGVEMDDLEIFVQDTTLTISGQWHDLSEAAIKWHRQERPLGEFTRRIELPENVDASKIEATMKHGVLTLIIPLAVPNVPRKIEVKTMG